jgi:hypothetical protein
MFTTINYLTELCCWNREIKPNGILAIKNYINKHSYARLFYKICDRVIIVEINGNLLYKTHDHYLLPIEEDLNQYEVIRKDIHMQLM